MCHKALLLNFKESKIYYGSGKSQKDFAWNFYDLITREKQHIKNKRNVNSMECFFFKNEKLIYQ